MQTGSFPSVCPDGANFPSMSWTERSTLYHSTLLSDLRPVLLSIDAPESGDWFLVAFVYDDSKRIKQAVRYYGKSFLNASILYMLHTFQFI